MNNPNFSKVATFIFKQVLSYHYVLLLRLGGYSWYMYWSWKKIQINPGWENLAWEDPSYKDLAWKTQKTNYMTRCHQKSWPGIINLYIHKTAEHQTNILSPIFLSSRSIQNRLSIRRISYFQNFHQVKSLEADSMADGCFISQYIFLQGTSVSKLIVKRACRW